MFPSIRLGEAEKAMYHYKLAEAGSEELEKVRALQEHLQKCTEAKQRRDWSSIVKETESAMKSGATSSPQVSKHKTSKHALLITHDTVM